MYKFIKLEKATDKKHKYQAIFLNEETNREKTVPFGAKGYNDYLIYNKITTKEEADKHRERYIKRHAKDNLTDAISAGSLSMFLLWGEHKTLNENLKDYLQRFKDQIS